MSKTLFEINTGDRRLLAGGDRLQSDAPPLEQELSILNVQATLTNGIDSRRSSDVVARRRFAVPHGPKLSHSPNRLNKKLNRFNNKGGQARRQEQKRAVLAVPSDTRLG